MSKLKLCILDRDKKYVESLSGYMMAYYRHRFYVSVFSECEVMLSLMKGKESLADIILVSEECFGDWAKKIDNGLVIVLSGSGAPSDKDVPRVYKYAGAERLIGDILRIYSQEGVLTGNADQARGRRDGKIIAIESPDGGAGRTTVALALCEHLARQKLRTLYIDLDWTGVLRSLEDVTNEEGMSDIIYTIKARPERLGLKLEALARPMPGGSFLYYPPVLYPMDADELIPQDIEIMIAKFRELGIFDRIVIDTHSGLSLRNITLFEHADNVLIIVGMRGQLTDVDKFTRFSRQIKDRFADRTEDILKRTQVLLNEYEFKKTDNDAICDDNLEFVRDLSELYKTKVSILPRCEAVSGIYRADAIASVAHDFGAGVAEIAYGL